MKKCSTCQIEKTLTEFYKDSKAKTGHSSRCKDCSREYHRQWSAKNPGYSTETSRQYRANNPEAYRQTRDRWEEDNPLYRIIRDNRVRARRWGVETDMTYDLILALFENFGRVCMACGTEHSDETYVGLDHIVPMSRGGADTLSNIQILCLDCNRRKYLEVVDYR